MNLHPIAVHFPIALLTVYSILEFVRLRKITSQPYWFYIKAIFVVFGSMGTLGALFTGDMAANLIKNDAQLRVVKNVHENFADATTFVFGILAVCYFISFLERAGYFTSIKNSFVNAVWKFLLKIKHLAIETPIVVFLALVGLILVTITGSLGGYMVYGEKVDPVVKFVYHIFF
jgi:uncharacterized membrane protein